MILRPDQSVDALCYFNPLSPPTDNLENYDAPDLKPSDYAVTPSAKTKTLPG